MAGLVGNDMEGHTRKDIAYYHMHNDPHVAEALQNQEEQEYREYLDSLSQKKIKDMLADDVAALEREEKEKQKIKELPTTEQKSQERKVEDSSNEVRFHVSPSEVEDVGPPLPPELGEITSGYAEGEFPNKPDEQGKFRLFKKRYLDLPHSLGYKLLSGEEQDIEDVLDAIKNDSELLNVVVTVKDPLGTSITGTLIQIAAMAGDFDLSPEIKDEKQRGLVERMADAGKLSKEKVAEELFKCITSPEAIQANNDRVQRYITIIHQFGNSICEGKITKEDAIAQFIKDLKTEREKEVRSGFIMDPRILQEVFLWSQDNKKRMGNERYITFVTVCGGNLQANLPYRGAQVVRAGIGRLYPDSPESTIKIPPRTLKNADGTSHFYNNNSRLGVDRIFKLTTTRTYNREDTNIGFLENVNSGINEHYLIKAFKAFRLNLDVSIKKLCDNPDVSNKPK